MRAVVALLRALAPVAVFVAGAIVLAASYGRHRHRPCTPTVTSDLFTPNPEPPSGLALVRERLRHRAHAC